MILNRDSVNWAFYTDEGDLVSYGTDPVRLSEQLINYARIGALQISDEPLVVDEDTGEPMKSKTDAAAVDAVKAPFLEKRERLQERIDKKREAIAEARDVISGLQVDIENVNADMKAALAIERDARAERNAEKRRAERQAAREAEKAAAEEVPEP